jgi:hypothetical protein
MEFEKFAMQSSGNSLSMIPANHEIKVVIRQIGSLMAQSFAPDDVAIAFCSKVVNLLFKTDVLLLQELCVAILEVAFEVSKKAQKEVVGWLFYLEEDVREIAAFLSPRVAEYAYSLFSRLHALSLLQRKYNVDVLILLLRSAIIPMVEFDLYLGKQIDLGRSSVVDLAVELVRRCSVQDASIAKTTDFRSTVQALARLGQRAPLAEKCVFNSLLRLVFSFFELC